MIQLKKWLLTVQPGVMCDVPKDILEEFGRSNVGSYALTYACLLQNPVSLYGFFENCLKDKVEGNDGKKIENDI